MSDPQSMNLVAEMEKAVEEQNKEAREFADFYFDLFENQQDRFQYYLSDTPLLDWFGQTVKGIKNIVTFLKYKVAEVRHIFPVVEHCDKIGYRDSHVVKYTLREIKSPPVTLNTDAEITPPNKIIPSGSRIKEEGQGDGIHNCNSETPIKKSRLTVTEDSSESSLEIQNITSNGHIEFHRKSTKGYQRETKWKRPCKFQVAYSKTDTDYIIHLIIYQGDMKVRRNLLKEFEEASVSK